MSAHPSTGYSCTSAHSSTLHIPCMGPPAVIRNNIPPSPSVINEDISTMGPWSTGSVKDAKDQGRKKKQSGVPKETYYLQLAGSVFANDEDPEMRLLFKQNPKAFIKPVQILKHKYNEVNATLKQSGTGTGMMFDDLQKDPETKTLLVGGEPIQHETQYRHLQTLDKIESAALQHFNMSGSKDVQVFYEEKNVLKDGKIMDMDNTDIHPDDVDPVPAAD
ncbi:hypothetical protein BDR07DRAFT_1491371 [Suillus spraguei]|nr:hypothetical protein BDR07DRAFT_1493326 [Suillus spraguei]KAG2356844.1 hypothetical protein BDR07DRAFT_1491371 [Suillus spraguei]